MKTLSAVKEKRLLEPGIENVHRESLEWLRTISFWKEESMFYTDFINNSMFQNIALNDKRDVADLINLILGDRLNKIEKDIRQHEKKLIELIKESSSDVEYRHQHKLLGNDFSDFEKQMAICKKSVFELFKLVNFKNTSEVINIINNRRSVRKYKKESVEKKHLEQIINAGRMAPSAMNKQPWKFYVLNDSEKIRSYSTEISKVAENILHLSLKSLHKEEDPIFHGAPTVIFITAEEGNEWAPLDIGMCSQNIMLAAKSFGYDSCPIGLAKAIEKTSVYKELQIPETEKIILAIALGHGNENPPVHPRLTNNIVYFN